ncbi:MAG TPA: hypothetical protein VN754_05795 [Candidatus Binataceae bacterium]|nr:hypothetical protein [Candidatus Binataceae bacterium]
MNAHAQQLVGQSVGVLARGPAPDDPLGGAPQILHQYDSQRDRDCPQFADRQGLHLLISADKAAQHLGVKPAVGVRDKCPGDSKYPRVAFQGTVSKLGQLPVVSGRKIVANQADLFLRSVKVIYQPLRRWRYRALLMNRLRDGAIRLHQHPAVVPKPGSQAPPGLWFIRNTLGDSQTRGVLLQALHAEEFGPNWLLGVLNGWVKKLPKSLNY